MARGSKLNITLSSVQRQWLERQVGKGDFASAGDVIRHLVRQAQVATSREGIEEALLDAGPSRPLTPARWNKIRSAARARLASAQQEQPSRRRRSA